jgi:hypothetical protein
MIACIDLMHWNIVVLERASGYALENRDEDIRRSIRIVKILRLK